MEIRVPLKSIRFKSGADVRMGVLFWRRVSRLGVSASWPDLPRGMSIFTRYAPLHFKDLKQPLMLEAIPNVTYSLRQNRSTRDQWGKADSKPDAGITVKYGITSSVTLDGTFRPDFSQVESDSFQVEVNQRYPIFYSEKRPFFMEGMGTFELAGAGGDGNTRTAYQISRRFSVRAIAQYDSSRARILTDFLGSYELVPGTVAYAGYGSLFERRSWDGQQLVQGPGDYLSTQRGLFFKVSYLHRF